MLNEAQVLECLLNVDALPPWGTGGHRAKCRTIYEAGNKRGYGSGKFYIDYQHYPGGTEEEVPRRVIDKLEKEGVIVRAFPKNPQLNVWRLANDGQQAQGEEQR